MNEDRLGVFALLCTGATGVLAFVMLLLRVLVIPVYLDMFQDFGGSLPRLTRLVCNPAWPVVSAAILLLIAAAAAVPILPVNARRALALLGTATGLLAIVATFAGLYLPMFAVSGALSP